MKKRPTGISILFWVYLILGILACYGVHRLVLVVTFWRGRRMASPAIEPPLEWPVVTVEPLIYALRQSLERARKRLEREGRQARSGLHLPTGMPRRAPSRPIPSSRQKADFSC